MEFTYADIIGITAGLMLAISNIPQLIKIITTRDTKSISLIMYIIYITGIILWLVYGIVLKSLSVIIANGLGLCTAFPVLTFKLINVIKNKEKV